MVDDGVEDGCCGWSAVVVVVVVVRREAFEVEVGRCGTGYGSVKFSLNVTRYDFVRTDGLN